MARGCPVFVSQHAARRDRNAPCNEMEIGAAQVQEEVCWCTRVAGAGDEGRVAAWSPSAEFMVLGNSYVLLKSTASSGRLGASRDQHRIAIEVDLYHIGALLVMRDLDAYDRCSANNFDVRELGEIQRPFRDTKVSLC